MGKGRLYLDDVARSLLGRFSPDELKRAGNLRRITERVEAFFYGEEAEEIGKWLKGRKLVTLAKLAVAKPQISYEFGPLSERLGRGVLIEMARRNLACQLAKIAAEAV